MKRDKDLYKTAIENKIGLNVRYTTDFDPSAREDYDEVHWIIDEADELMFNNPQHFYENL